VFYFCNILHSVKAFDKAVCKIVVAPVFNYSGLCDAMLAQYQLWPCVCLSVAGLCSFKTASLIEFILDTETLFHFYTVQSEKKIMHL